MQLFNYFIAYTVFLIVSELNVQICAAKCMFSLFFLQLGVGGVQSLGGCDLSVEVLKLLLFDKRCSYSIFKYCAISVNEYTYHAVSYIKLWAQMYACNVDSID